MGPDNSPPQIVPLNSNNKKGPDNVPLVTALLQHGIPFLPPLKLFIPIQPPEISRNDPAN